MEKSKRWKKKAREEETRSKNRKRNNRESQEVHWRPGQKLFKDVKEGSMEREVKGRKEREERGSRPEDRTANTKNSLHNLFLLQTERGGRRRGRDWRGIKCRPTVKLVCFAEEEHFWGKRENFSLLPYASLCSFCCFSGTTASFFNTQPPSLFR